MFIDFVIRLVKVPRVNETTDHKNVVKQNLKNIYFTLFYKMITKQKQIWPKYKKKFAFIKILKNLKILITNCFFYSDNRSFNENFKWIHYKGWVHYNQLFEEKHGYQTNNFKTFSTHTYLYKAGVN